MFDGLYAVAIEDANGWVHDSYTSFERLRAAQVYNKWKDQLMKSHTEWWEEMERHDDEDIC